MTTLALRSLNCCMAFESDCPSTLDFLLGPDMATLVPSYTCTGNVKYPLRTVRFLDQSQAALRYRHDGVVELCGRWGDAIEGGELGRFISIHFEPLYHRHALYPFHSCVVACNGEALALLGERGVGKTSTGLTLCLRYGFRFVCNSRAVIQATSCGGFTVIAGVRPITIRADLARFVTALASQVPPIALPWSRHLLGDAAALHIPSVGGEAVPLRAFLIVRLNPAVQEFRQLSVDESMTELYEQSSRMIRMGTVILKGAAAIPCLDTPELAAQRLVFIRELAASLPLMRITGSMEYICKEAHAFMREAAASRTVGMLTRKS